MKNIIADSKNINLLKGKVKEINKISENIKEIEPLINKIQKDVLYKNEFISEFDGSLVKDPINDYELNKEDLDEYCKQLNEIYIKIGFDVKLNYCPLLIAESELRQAQRELADLLEPITNINRQDLICSGLENYRKYIKLSVDYISTLK